MKLKKFVERISLEDADVGAAGADTKVDLEQPVEVVSESIDKEIESSLDVEPSESIEKDLEKVEAVTVALEQYSDVLTQSLARGGLRPEEGQLLNVALEHFDRVLGLESQVLSMEDFGGKMSRREATQVSLENVGDKIKTAAKKAWELIVELFKKLKENLAGVKAKSAKLAEFFDHSAKEAKKPVDTEVKANKFEVEVPAILAGISDTSNVVNVIREAVKKTLELRKQTLTYVEQVSKVIDKHKGITEEAEAEIKTLKLFGNVPYGNIDVGGLLEIEYTETDFIPELKVEAKSNETKKVHLGFEEYLKLNGSTKVLSVAVADLYKSAEAVSEKYFDVTQSIYEKFGEDAAYTKVRGALIQIDLKLSRTVDHISAAETGVARIIRQVQKELEKRASGKGASTDE